MKINCENCGTLIDIEKDSLCPNCKAPYDKNKEFLEYKEQKKREELLSFRQKETVTNLTEKIAQKFDDVSHPKPIKRVVPAFVAIAAIVIIVIAFSTINSVHTEMTETRDNFKMPDFDFSSLENATKDMFKKKEYTEKEVSVGPEISDGIRVTCDKVLTTESNKEGLKEVLFHLVVENLSTVSKIVSRVNCEIDGSVQRTSISFDYDDLPKAGFVDAKQTVDGYKSFLVPIDATEVDLVINEKIRLHVNIQ